MEVLAGLLELLYLLTLLWVATSVPLWATLGAITYFGSRRSRSIANAPAEGGGPRASAETTRLARPAMAMAFVVVAQMLLTIAVFAAAVTLGVADSVDWLFWAAVVMVMVADVAGVALTVLLVAVMRDVLTEKRAAGRETLVAYTVVGSMYAAMLGAGLAVGVYSHLVP